MITAKKIEGIVRTGAVHVLYSAKGNWYHHLKEFPGVLFDTNGYIKFLKEKDYTSCPYLRHRQDLNVPDGIGIIPGYQFFTDQEKKRISDLN